MAYIYQADVWCDECGEEIRKELTEAGKAPSDPDDESSYDSANFPKYYDAENESADGPQNCASGTCADYTETHGTFLGNQLTADGYRYVQSMLSKYKPATIPKHAQEWAVYYGFEYKENPFATAHEWLESKPICEYLIALLDKIDGDMIQDTFQNEMDEDGFFHSAGWYSNEMEDA